MALADITINDGQGTPVSHTFTYVATNGSKVIRRDMTAATETPLTLTIGHQSAKKAGLDVDSHLVRIDEVTLDTDGITGLPSDVRVMVDVPKKIASDAMADNYAAYLRDLFTSAFMRALFKGSVG